MSDHSLMDLKDQGRLELTLSARESIIRELMKDNKLPSAEEDRSLLVKMMDGMDRTILSKAKIKSEDTAAKLQSQTTQKIASLLLAASNRPRLQRTEIIELGSDVPEPQLVEGETFIGVQTFKSSEILGED